MNKQPKLHPYDVPNIFRHLLYDRVVLAWETDGVLINSSIFSKKVLHASIVVSR